MSDPVTIYKWIFIIVCVFLVVEAVVDIVKVMQNPPGNSETKALLQAKTWIRSLFMLTAAGIIFTLSHSGSTNAIPSTTTSGLDPSMNI